MSGAQTELGHAPAGFEAGRLRGRGALSVTFDVVRAGERFVCKRLVARAARDAGALLAAHDEACVLEALAGRGAPTLVSRGDDEHGPFLVMTTAPGAPLGARIAHARASSPAWLDSVARASFAELARVHEAADGDGPLDVVHADVSPDNVLVDGDGDAVRVSLVDFGLARFRGASRGADGAFRGTARYAAPELARGETSDARADLFAMAATLLHVGSQLAPHDGVSGAALLMHAGEGALDAYAHAAGAFFPLDVAHALARCVAFDRDARPPRARDVFSPKPW